MVSCFKRRFLPAFNVNVPSEPTVVPSVSLALSASLTSSSVDVPFAFQVICSLILFLPASVILLRSLSAELSIFALVSVSKPTVTVEPVALVVNPLLP